MKLDRRELFTLPNLMGYFRILLIPLFAYFYLTAKNSSGCYLAAGVIALSGLTDLFDGKVARKLHQVTELGKFLDPLADKLTLGVLILCFALRWPWVWALAALYLIKEGFMAVMGLLLLRRNGRKLDGAMWFGKVCTAALYVLLFLLLLFPALPAFAVNLLLLVCGVVMLGTLLLYIPVFKKMWRLPPIGDAAKAAISDKANPRENP